MSVFVRCGGGVRRRARHYLARGGIGRLWGVRGLVVVAVLMGMAAACGVDVVAQLRSSTAIVSLTGVVLELLKNSLDAKATRVDAAVDFARGGCVVEDDGLGIAPLEFAQDGGLGKLYCMSCAGRHLATY